ncbi:MAG: glycoside hydrolase family 20 zincin-like fold domain-containing protein [Gemmatimonadaceae bacterium]
MRLALSFVALLLVAAPLAAQDAPRLIPAPREIVRSDPPARFAAEITVEAGADADDRFAAQDFAETMTARGFRAAVTASDRGWHVDLLRAGTEAARRVLERENLRFTQAMEAEGYILVTGTEGATVIAATSAGVFHGLQTLKQLITGAGSAAQLHRVAIRDWPAMQHRGVQDDISRGPVPTLEYQKRQVRAAAGFKLNIFSLCFEHTLAFNSHPLIAPPGGAMSHDDVRELVAYARRYHVTILPQQQTFGHLHHALKLDLYADVAEQPHGHVLAPGVPRSLEIVREIYAELDSLFPSPFVHLGADETFELGLGRTKPAVDAQTVGPVYLDYVRRTVETVRRPGKRYLFWGDIAMNHPELVSRLPRDLIAVGWDYWSRSNFDRYLKPFRDAGMETWIAPGVNNWNRIWPQTSQAMANIQGFARDGQRGGATGMINTTWDDNGDAIFEQNWHGIAFGAAAAWQAGEADTSAFKRAFGSVFYGDTTGRIDRAYAKLAAAHEAIGRSGAGDGLSYLFFLDPWTPEGVFESARLLPVLQEARVHAESALVLVAQARRQSHLRELTALDAMELGARRLDWLGMKFQLADEIAQRTIRATAPGRTDVDWKELSELTGINGRLQDMRDGFVLTRELFERSWRAENRPYWLQNNLARYDAEVITWVRRTNVMDQARRQHARTKTIPTAVELGVPATLVQPRAP